MSLPAPSPDQVSPGSDVVLSVTGLSRSFGDVAIVARFDATVARGERLALHGPNGSGKSTILRCLSGTLAPTSGEATVLGHAAGSFEARTQTGTSSAQERSFYRRLTGMENLLFFARLRHVSKRSAIEQVRELCDELDLDDILSRRVDRCSTGMVQQLSFARALLGWPQLLLLDEPTRSLDDQATTRIWEALDRRDHLGLVIASHLETDLQRCDSIHELPT